MGGIFWLFLRVLVTPEVQKTTPGGPGAALDHPPLAGLNVGLFHKNMVPSVALIIIDQSIFAKVGHTRVN